jgi:hypothetical protein
MKINKYLLALSVVVSVAAFASQASAQKYRGKGRRHWQVH